VHRLAHAPPALFQCFRLPVDPAAYPDGHAGAGGHSQDQAPARSAQLATVVGRLQLLGATPPAAVQPVGGRLSPLHGRAPTKGSRVTPSPFKVGAAAPNPERARKSRYRAARAFSMSLTARTICVATVT